MNEKEVDRVANRSRATRLKHLLWAAIILPILVLVLTVIPATKSLFDYVAIAELLLVSVIAVEGLLAIRELSETRQQLAFDSVVRIYESSRELHSLGFTRPALWKFFSIQAPDTWNEESELTSRFVQLFMNQTALMWEADKHGYLDKERWRKDNEHFIRTPEVRNFWETHAQFYPEDFGLWVKGILENA